MYTKKPKEMGSQLMICGQVHCVKQKATYTVVAKSLEMPIQYSVFCFFSVFLMYKQIIIN